MKDIVSKRIKKAVYNIPQGYEARIEGNKVIVEAKENEDERIWIINYLNNSILNSTIIAEKENLKKAIAWLEKQGETSPVLSNSSNIGKVEQKPAWSEEDEKLVKNLISTLSNLYARNLIEKETKEKYINLLKPLKDRVQPKQEWSEEDKKRMNHIIQFLEDKDRWKDSERAFPIEEDIRWLKSLRPQNTWKPSAAQMYALKEEVENKIYSGVSSDLSSLYHDLIKLL